MIDYKKIIPIFLICFAFTANLCFAGFGISPPYVASDNLMAGSHYEQSISLIRSDVDKEAKVIIQKDLGEIADWIKIENEDNLIYKQGDTKVVMKVFVDIPRNVELKQYKGKILVSVPNTDQISGGAAIALGAQIDVDLTITDQVSDDFEITAIKILDCYEGEDIRALFGIRNKGNIELQPKKITMEIYDINDQNLLDLVEGQALGVVPPNTKADLEVRFLPKMQKPGVYWAKIKVYNGENVVADEKVFLSIKANTPERKAMLESFKTRIQNNLFPCSISSRYFYLIVGLVVLAFILLAGALFILLKQNSKNNKDSSANIKKSNQFLAFFTKKDKKVVITDKGSTKPKPKTKN
jgi:hypothetical protein